MDRIYTFVLLSSSKFNLERILLYSSFMYTQSLSIWSVCHSGTDQSMLVSSYSTCTLYKSDQQNSKKDYSMFQKLGHLLNSEKKISFNKQIHQLPWQQINFSNCFLVVYKLIFKARIRCGSSLASKAAIFLLHSIRDPQKLIKMIYRTKHIYNDTYYDRKLGFKPEIVGNYVRAL